MEHQTFAAMVAKRLEALRQADGLVCVRMNGPNGAVLDALRDLGISTVSHYDRWCHNTGTCSHQSHDPGQDWIEAWLPASWVDEAKDACQELWEYRDDECPLCMLPTRELVVAHAPGHYAGYTWVVGLRPEVKILLGEHADDGDVYTP